MNERELKLKECKRKKRLALKIWLACLVIIAVAVVLAVFIPSLEAVLTVPIELLCVIWLILPVVIGFPASLKQDRIKRSYCEKCGYHYDYEDDIAWEEISRREANSKVFADIEFECNCEKCGSVQRFKESFVLAEIKNGQVKQYSVRNQAKKFFI